MKNTNKIRLRALLLAAGYGTRLRPLTLSTPKCLVKIGHTPLLQRWLLNLEALGCESCLVNTHYLSEQVISFVQDWPKSSMSLQTVHETTLLGTAGTMLANRDFFENSTGLLIHADNITSANLVNLIKAHRKKPKECLLTMLTFKTSSPRNCGIVVTDSNGVMQEFHEKVANPPGNCANGAIYLFDKPFLDWLTKLPAGVEDFSMEIIPQLKGRIQTWHTTDPYLDIGTTESLQEAQKLFSQSLGDN